MSKEEEEILDKIREKVLAREKELQQQQDKEANLEATLQALEEITDVPRSEMNRIAEEIKASYQNPPAKVETQSTEIIPIQDKLPATVREAISKLPPVLKEEFYEEYALAERKTGLSYLFWLIPPPFSCYYLYNRKIFKQILFTITLGGALIWWIVDAWNIRKIVEEENRKTARKYLKMMMKRTLRRQKHLSPPPFSEKDI